MVCPLPHRGPWSAADAASCTALSLRFSAAIFALFCAAVALVAGRLAVDAGPSTAGPSTASALLAAPAPLPAALSRWHSAAAAQLASASSAAAGLDACA